MSDCGRVLYDSNISSSYSLIKSPICCYHRPRAYGRACKPLRCCPSRLYISKTGSYLIYLGNFDNIDTCIYLIL